MKKFNKLNIWIWTPIIIMVSVASTVILHIQHNITIIGNWYGFIMTVFLILITLFMCLYLGFYMLKELNKDIEEQ